MSTTFQDLINIGMSPRLPWDQRIALMVSNSIALTALAGCFVMIPIYLWMVSFQLVALNVLVILSFSSILFANRLEQYETARHLTIVNCLFWITVSIFLYGVDSGAAYFLVSLSIVPFVIYQRGNFKFALLSSGISLVMFCLLETVYYHDFANPIFQFSEEKFAVIRKVYIVIAFAGVLFPALITLHMLKLSHSVLRKQSLQKIRDRKLKGLGEIAAGVAHEVANPLAIIRGRVAVLENLFSRNHSNEEVSYQADSVLLQLERTRTLMRELKSLSTDISGVDFQKMDALELVYFAMSCCKERVHAIGATLEVIQDKIYAESELFIVGNRDNLIQVIVNLVNNSCDAIEGQSERWIKISLETDGRKVFVKLWDSGPGVPHEDREKIFRPFYTTKPAGKGTGLGLAISKRVLEIHDATIELQPDTEATCFVLEFEKAFI